MFGLLKHWDDPVETQLETLTHKSRGSYRKRRKVTTTRAESAQALLTFIADHNGKKLSYARMARELRCAEGYISVLIGDLAKAGAIKREGKVGHYRYFARRRKVAPQVRTKRNTPFNKAPVVRKKPVYDKQALVNYLEVRQGTYLRQEHMAQALGVSKGTIKNYLRELEEDNVVAKGRTVYNVGATYKVNPKAKVDPTPKNVQLDKVAYRPGSVIPTQGLTRDEKMIREFLKFYKTMEG